MQAGKIDFGEEASVVLKERWGKLMRQYTSVNIPKGWIGLVESMFKELAALRGKKDVCLISAEWGSLETDFWVTRASGKVYVPYEILLKYRQESHQTCYECGGYGGRVIIRGQVQVACRPCYSVLESNRDGTHTGTWLDEV